ncbi:MAG: hypothetical protein NWR72_19210 [Bacteroidia bacterium]|nr:hypothetical protein [Bacteroidia bacterium]
MKPSAGPECPDSGVALAHLLHMDRRRFFSFGKEYYFLPLLIYSLGMGAVYAAAYLAGLIDLGHGAASFFRWDAKFYLSIAENGYLYGPDVEGNTGFFPLFSLLWRITGASVPGVQLINTGIFFVSLARLCKSLKPDIMVLGFFLTSPFVFFMFVPLTESLFFATSVLVIAGIHEQKRGMVFLGVLLSSLTRASFFFLIPAGVGMLLMNKPIRQIWSVNTWREILLQFLLPAGLGLITVLLIQWWQTGEWFSYFELQGKAWGRVFSLPAFPIALTTEFWAERWSYLSFALCCLALGVGIWYFVKWLKGRDVSGSIGNEELFAVIFVVMSLASIVFFNPKWYYFGLGEYHSTVLTGVNRYTQATAYFFVFLIFLFRQPKISLRRIALFIPVTYLIWLLVFPAYVLDVHPLWKMTTVTLILCSYAAYHATRWRPLAILLMLCSMAFQVAMVIYFVKEELQID